MIKDTRWNSRLILLFAATALLVISTPPSDASTFDVRAMVPVADRNIRTGNKMLIEREITATDKHEEDMREQGRQGDDATATDDDGVLDVNELPVRYDEAQLWRIYNISESMSRRRNMMPLADILESKYGRLMRKSCLAVFFFLRNVMKWKLIFFRRFFSGLFSADFRWHRMEGKLKILRCLHREESH